MNVYIEKDVEETFEFEFEELIKNVIFKSLDYLKCPYESEISVLLTDNKGIQNINNEFRQIDKPTDVLSFPIMDYITPGDFEFLEESDEAFNPETGELMLGDIIISIEKVKQQAEDYGHTQIRELAFLITHSILHLVGYDHIEQDDMQLMLDKQNNILDELGIKR